MLYRLARPLLFRLPAETAHTLTLRGLALSPIGARAAPAPALAQRVAGIVFPNPVGLAPGFDKNGQVPDALIGLGFGSVEIGTVTPKPQAGNARPRLFRLVEDEAVINRMGFNNDGSQIVAERLTKRLGRPGIVGANIGANKDSPDRIADYAEMTRIMAPLATYLTVNVSSPNTPNLRELQRSDLLSELLQSLQKRNNELAQASSALPKPLLLKIAPDLDQSQIESIIEVALRANISGVIATNTTIRRDNLQTPPAEVQACGEGGLSGAPLRNQSNQVISLVYRLTRGELPIIGVGGIFTADDAWEKISAGASLIQLYTGFIYEGPGVAKRINEGLIEILRREGFDSIDDAVGCRPLS